MTVADRIKKVREEKGMSQTELAKKMGYSGKSSVSRAETLGDDIGSNRIKKFAKALNVSVAYLMGWEEEELDAVGDAELLKKYHLLTEGQKQVVLELIDQFIAN